MDVALVESVRVCCSCSSAFFARFNAVEKSRAGKNGDVTISGGELSKIRKYLWIHQVAEEIVVREVESFRMRLVAQDAVPTILELQQRLEAIRSSELEKCLRKVGPVTGIRKGSYRLSAADADGA